MKRLILAVALFALVGCGPTLYELKQRTTSDLNVIAQEWDGKANPPDLKGRLDPWGNQYQAAVTKEKLNYKLSVRSPGPDRLPYNSDDLVVTRQAAHGETTQNLENEGFFYSISKGIFGGARDGVTGKESKK
jgi:hypothetical protein